MVWAANGAVLRIRPVVLLNIAHLFEKRENTERAVVGALIGTYDSQQYVYEATGCLPVMF